jgi:hypothetical protein
LLSPQFSVKYPGLVDDGTDLLYVKTNSYWHIIVQQLFDNERTRPLRYLWRKILFDIWGLNMWGYYFVGAITLAIISLLLFLILKKLTNKPTMAVIIAFLFMISPPVVANFYRLGTDEPMQLLLYLLSLYCWLNRKYWWVCWWLLLGLFVKETGIFFGLLWLILLLTQRKWKLVGLSLITLLAVSWLVVEKYVNNYTGYMHHANLSWGILILNLRNYWIYFIVSCLVLAVLIKKASAKAMGKMLEEKIVIGFIVASWIPVSFWRMNNDYYLLLIYCFTLIGLGLVANISLRTNSTTVKIIYWGSIYLLVMDVCVYTVPTVRNLHDNAVADAALSGYLLNNDFKGIEVFSRVKGPEANDKIRKYINEWKEMDGTNLTVLENNLSVFINSRDKSRILISEGKIAELTGFKEQPVCGSSIFVGNICKYYIYRPLN